VIFVENMDKRKIYLISLSAGIAVMSVVSVLMQLFWQVFDNYGGLAIVLLRIYIFLAGINLIEVYVEPILPKKRKTNNVILNSIVISTLYMLTHMGGLWIHVLLDILIIIIAILFYVVQYYIRKAYTKRMNKKLNEYKQKNDDILEK
jgi:uncharacterized membrane protein